MTDEGPMDEGQMSEPPQPSQPAAGGGAAALSEIADFSTGEGLVAFAGLVLLLDWVIFTVILDEYFFSFFTLVLAFIALIVPRMKAENVAKVLPAPVIMKVMGYALALIGVFDIIEAIRFGFYDQAGDIIAALASYVAFAMAYLGARQIKT